MDAHLRPDGARPLKLKTHLSFKREGGILRAVTQCSGVGICRKRGEGVMCPSYAATGEERLSTRGRANALRAVLAGELPPEELTGEELHEAISLCLACKGCQSECPSSVDMARLKVEVLAHYYRRHGTPLGAAVMGRIDLLSLGSLKPYSPTGCWKPADARSSSVSSASCSPRAPPHSRGRPSPRASPRPTEPGDPRLTARASFFADTFTNLTRRTPAWPQWRCWNTWATRWSFRSGRVAGGRRCRGVWWSGRARWQANLGGYGPT